eukprot:COSAG01_NODE_2317_length_7922_cov_18.384763_7_plen_91_part_00
MAGFARRMCWDVTYGLDIQSPNPAMWSEEGAMDKCPPASAHCMNWTKTIWRGFQHFHTHAGILRRSYVVLHRIIGRSLPFSRIIFGLFFR